MSSPGDPTIRGEGLLMLNPQQFFLDRDKDGVVDTVDLQLHLYPSCGHRTLLSAVMDLCACLGFETMGMEIPLVKAGENRDGRFRYHLHIGTQHEIDEISSRKEDKDFYLTGEDELALARAVEDFASSVILRRATQYPGIAPRRSVRRETFDLLNPFSTKGFYVSDPRDPLPVLFPYKIVLLSQLRPTVAAQAANFAARLGLETVHLSLPLTLARKQEQARNNPFIYIGLKSDLRHFEKVSLPILSSRWDSSMFVLPSPRMMPDVLICGTDQGLTRMLGSLSILPTDSKRVRAPAFMSIEKFRAEIERPVPEERRGRRNVEPKRIEREYIIPDERKEVFRWISEGLGTVEKAPASVEIHALMVRPEITRKALEQEIKQNVKHLGVREGEIKVSVLNAYKPGLSWLREVVLKELKKRKVDRVEIAFREFKAEGLEEPLRWLQEIYPIDEILARGLHISARRISFKKDSRLKQTYRIRAWRRGHWVYQDGFSPPWRRLSYLKPFPRLGNVHPCTGWFRMTVDHREVINQRWQTGIDYIWEKFQNELLPLMENEAKRVFPICGSRQGIFEEIRFDVFLDYPGEPLAVDAERISPLEALHEDLYFVTLDFLSRWAKKQGLRNISAGRVLPVIHPSISREKERMTFTLVHGKKARVTPSVEPSTPQVSLEGIVLHRSRMGARFLIEPTGMKNRSRLRVFQKVKEIANRHGIKIGRVRGDGVSIHKPKRFIGWSPARRTADFSKKKAIGKAMQIPLGKPIGYGEGVRLLKSLERFPSVRIVDEGRSSGGLPLFSIENIHPCPSAFVSHLKRARFKPTFFINCRHHANEVSSTNAGFLLCCLLASEPSYRRLLERANVVVNPMENVDGVVILEEMLKLTPTDKLHAGRYNQAGQEYYAEYFDPQTPFGEARVKPGIWQRWVPDFCADDHGFPSHEWEQPFSGYVPLRFRDWWIPRSLFFIYLPYLEDEEGSTRRTPSDFLSKRVEDALLREVEVTAKNRALSERYWKYRTGGSARSPNSRGGTRSFPLQKRFRRTNYAYRFPHITTLDLITEVGDETAQGHLLKTCIRAHLACNLAIIKLLYSSGLRGNKVHVRGGRGTEVMWWRERPLEFKKMAEREGIPRR
jgi:hypothetical protein